MKTTNQLCFIGVESPLSVGPMLGQCQHANNDVLPLPDEILIIYFSRNTVPISTKHDMEHF